LQALLTDTREAHAADTCQLSAEKDMLAEQSEVQRVQVQQHIADLEALRQDLAAAIQGIRASIQAAVSCSTLQAAVMCCANDRNKLQH